MDQADYTRILIEFEEEKHACNYAYGKMVPAFYVLALNKAIEAIKGCQDCEKEARRMIGGHT